MNRLLRVVLGLLTMGLILAATAFAFQTHGRAQPSIIPGYTTMTIAVAHRDRPVMLHIWYPTNSDIPPELIGQNALFYGEWVRRDAPPVPGPAPVVLISHGSGGNAVQLGWLATALARAGMIVVAPNHPGTTSRDSDPFQTVQIWQRPLDLTAALDALAKSPPDGLVPDLSRVAVLGFSLGGHSALSLSGVQVIKAGFITYCTKSPDQPDCSWMSKAGVNFAQIDQTRYEASYRDPRITATVAVDPALDAAMSAESLGKIDHPVLILNLGLPETIPIGVRADGIAAQIKDAKYHAIDGAHHFSFIAECSGLGWAIIGMAGEENICSDTGFRDRATVHAEALAQILPFLTQQLGLGE